MIIYQLINSIIFNLRVTIYVFNTYIRFIDFKKAKKDNILLVRKSII
jgi:hypothetical protein